MKGTYRKWWALVAMSGAYVMIYFDQALVTVALPTIQRELGISSLTTNWIMNAYLLSLAVFVITGGRLGDLFGLKKIYLTGLFIFTISTLVCGLAPDAITLIIFRAFEGIGAALIMPVSQALVYHGFSENERGRALGFYTALGVVFILIGPYIGGVVAEYLDWRPIFWLNVILSFFFIPTTFKFVKETHFEHQSARFDFPGQITLGLGLLFIVSAFMQSPQWGWNSVLTLIFLGIGILSAILFIVFERNKKHPLVELKVFRNPTFSGATFNFFSIQFAWIAIVYFSFFFQKDLGFSPIVAGLALIPLNFLSIFISPIVGNIVDKRGAKSFIITGLLITALSFIWIALIAPEKNYFLILIALIVYSFGLPFVFPANIKMTMQAVTQKQQGIAAGIGLGARQIGGAIGFSMMSMIALHLEKMHFKDSSTVGFMGVMGLAGFILLLAFVLSIFTLKEKRQKA